MSKWRLVVFHAWPSFVGLLRLVIKHPIWAIQLLKARITLFLLRRVSLDLTGPDGFHIETQNELISYWAFFVERECWTEDWGIALLKEKSPIVLDVGANAGVFTHWIWTQNSDTQLYVFEPLPRMASKIRAWTGRTGARVVLTEAAVSDYAGQASFFTDADNDTGASLLSDSSKRNKLTVPVLTLDSVVPSEPILLAKIDVEGCEPQVLKGASRTLDNTRFLLIEAHTAEALNRIREMLTDASWDCRRVGSSDYLFKRRTA